MPYILPESQFAAEFEKAAARCRGTGEPVFLTKDGFGDLVLLSEARYEQLCDRLERAENTLRALAHRAAVASARPSAAADEGADPAPPAAADASGEAGMDTGVFERRDPEDVKYDFRQELRRLGGGKP